MNRRGGFSLVEVLVVVATIGVLTVVLSISYSNYLSEARVSAGKTNAISVEQIAEDFNAKNGTYPDTIGKLKLQISTIKTGGANLNIIPDADETTLNNANGSNTLAYACLTSCISKKISGARITYWDFSEKIPKYVFLGDAKASSSFDYPSSVNDFASGSNSNCALTNTSSVYCWGYSGDGQFANNIEGEETATYPNAVYKKGVLENVKITSTSNGNITTCAVGNDGNAYCWGSGANGQLGNNSWSNSSQPVLVQKSGTLTGQTILSVSVGANHACALASNNQAYCWGDNYYGKLGNGDVQLNSKSKPTPIDMTGVLSGKTIKSITTGWDNSCVIANDDKVYCWGNNSYGQLGNGTTTHSIVPVAVDMSGVLAGKTAKSVTIGYRFTCIIANDDNAYCWGGNDNGRVGDGSTTNRTTPVAVSTAGVLSGKTIKKISASNGHACVIASDNKGYCWGRNSSGELGDGTSNSRSTTPATVVMTGELSGVNFTEISSGIYSTCALASNNKAYCWGSNNHNGLSQSASLSKKSSPIPINTSTSLSRLSIKGVSAGYDNGCVIASDDNVYCWGRNNFGQIGNNKTSTRLVPTKSISGPLLNKTLNTLEINRQLCATDNTDIPYCWGDSPDGQLGNGDKIARYIPTAVNRSGVLNGKTIKKFANGNVHTCAIASDNLAYCWGANWEGTLGDNTLNDSYLPVAVYTGGALNGKTILDITAGSEHICAIASDNLAYCWGDNSNGQLGNNTNTTSSAATAVYTSGHLSGKTIKSITSGSSHTCVIASDNLPYCWGANYYSSLGNGNDIDSNVPVPVSMSGVLNGKTVKKISSGSYHTCAVASDNKVYCWGANWSGALGNNSFTSSNIPVAVYTSGVLRDAAITNIDTGSEHTCVMTIYKEMSCWGLNNFGQLGNNTTTDSAVPVSVLF